jgi:hypothetical protein
VGKWRRYMKKKDTRAWRYTVAAQEDYAEVKQAAQRAANELGRDVGIEGNDLWCTYGWFYLPNPEHRTGAELTCEVVRPDRYSSHLQSRYEPWKPA